MRTNSHFGYEIAKNIKLANASDEHLLTLCRQVVFFALKNLKKLAICFLYSALDKISSLDQLDQTMKVVKSYDRISVIAMGIIIIAALVWSIIGSIPESVTAMGGMLSSDEVMDVKYTNQGSVKNIFVQRGDYIENGEVIARIERTDMLDQITQAQTTMENLLKA